jgi:urea transport system substrate-binding protein
MARWLHRPMVLFAVALLGSACATSSPSPVATTVVRVGFVVPLTGPDRAAAEPAIQGATVAITEVNSHQVAGAFTLQLVQIDDRSDAGAAKQACAGLVSTEHVAAILGAESATPGEACASVARSAGIPYLLVGGTAPSDCTPDVVYMGPLPDQRVTALVQFLIQQAHLTRFYVVGDSSPESSVLLSAAAGQIKTLGGSVLASERLPTNPDFGKLGQRIAAAHPDVTIDALSGPSQARFYAAVASDPRLSQMRFASLQMDEAAANGITASAAGIYLARDYLSADPAPGNQAWLAAMISRYGDGAIPTSLGAQAHDAIELLAGSIHIAASSKPDAIVRALTSASVDGPRGMVKIQAASHGYSTLSMHIGRLDASHLVRQLYVSQPIDPVLACR